jgi:hypothetical protein
VAISPPVQVAHNELAAAAASIGCTFAQPVTPGSLIAVYVSVGHSVSVSNVRDDLAVNAVVANPFDWVAGIQRLEHWAFMNHAGGLRTITANFNGSGSFRSIVAAEFKGAHPTNAIGVANNNSGTSATPSSGSVTPAVDGALLLASINDSAAPAVVSPFGEVFAEAVNDNDTEYLLQAIAAAVAAGWSMPSSAYGAIITAFYPAPIARNARIMAPQQRMLA